MTREERTKLMGGLAKCQWLTNSEHVAITETIEENRRLREALRPFAQTVIPLAEGLTPDTKICLLVTVADTSTACAVMGEGDHQ